MKIEVATLLSGSETPAGDGVTGALRCVVVLADKSRKAAVLKRAPLGEVVAEAFAGLLMRAWGLPVPQPVLVDEGGTLAFASVDVGYPNLKQHLGVSALPAGPARDAAVLIATDLACALPTAPLAAACDEAIDNRDRNLGNILWDGKEEAWIDHAFALGQGAHQDDLNKLCAMATGKAIEEQFCRGAVARGLLLDRSTPATIDAAMGETPLGDPCLASFVAARLAALGNRLLARFPRPTDLISEAEYK